MNVFNAMFSKVNGGLEQVFLHYTRVLQQQGNDVTSIIHPKAEIKPLCTFPKVHEIHNYNQYDPFAIMKLKRLIKREHPDCIITHSYRASYLFQKTRTTPPKIAVCHTNSHFNFGSDALIALTDEMRRNMMDAGWSKDRVFTVPNMIAIPENAHFQAPRNSDIPVIGACARMVAVKGLDIFIDALAELKRRKIPFKAKIAGDGKDRHHYIQQIKRHQLEDTIELLGWVTDTASFYKEIDIFCLPSREETFGMVVLESMLHSLPMVLSDLVGPRTIIGQSEAAIFVPPNDPVRLADGLERVILDNVLAKELAHRAFERVFAFSTGNVGPILQEALHQLCKNSSNQSRTLT